MSKRSLNKSGDITDIPLDERQDWLSRFYTSFDEIDIKELNSITSLPELALHLSLNGFENDVDDDISEGSIWYGLVSYIYFTQIKISTLKTSANSFFGTFDRRSCEQAAKYQMMLKRIRDIYQRKDIALALIQKCIFEFVEIDYQAKDKIFSLFERLKGSNKDFDAFSEFFVKSLTKSIIPSCDIPES